MWNVEKSNQDFGIQSKKNVLAQKQQTASLNPICTCLYWPKGGAWILIANIDQRYEGSMLILENERNTIITQKYHAANIRNNYSHYSLV